MRQGYTVHVRLVHVAKIEGKTIFDQITMSDIAYTVVVIKNEHEMWDEMMGTQQARDRIHPRRPPNSRKEGRNQERVQYYGMESRGYHLL